MALVTCPECRHMFGVTNVFGALAAACPHCGVRLPPEKIAEGVAEIKRREKQARLAGIGCLSVIAAIVLVVVLIGWLSSRGGGTSQSAASSNQSAPAPATPPPVATPNQSEAVSAVPVPLRDASGVPADFRDLWKTAASGGTAGKQGDYTYQYAASDDRAAAVMLPNRSPVMTRSSLPRSAISCGARFVRTCRARLRDLNQRRTATPSRSRCRHTPITCSRSKTRRAKAHTGRANRTRCSCGGSDKWREG